MDQVIYGLMALSVFAAAWLQWYWGFHLIASLAVWAVSFLAVFVLLRCSGHQAAFWSRCLGVWAEFNKVHWVSWDETRAMTVSVSLMIAVFSVMLWLMDQLIVAFLTYWV